MKFLSNEHFKIVMKVPTCVVIIKKNIDTFIACTVITNTNQVMFTAPSGKIL